MDCKTAQSLVIPYVNHELEDEELEEFLDHIRECKECYEELEIHFTVYYALQKLEEDEQVSFNIQRMLKENLKIARKKVVKRRVLHYLGVGIVAAAELLLLLTLGLQAELLRDQEMEKTAIYQFLRYGGAETESLSETETEKHTEAETEEKGKKTEVSNE